MECENKTKKYNIKQYIQLALIACCSVIFIMILEDVLEHEIMQFDYMVYNFISQFIHTPITNVLRVLTNLGGAVCIITITLLIVLIHKDKKVRSTYGSELSNCNHNKSSTKIFNSKTTS